MRSFSVWVLLLMVGGLTLLATRPAEASCSLPRTFFAPLEDTPLPARGAVYVFVSRYEYLGEEERYTAEDAAAMLSIEGASFELELVATLPDRMMFRADYRATGSSITLRWRDRLSTHPIAAPTVKNHACVLDMVHLNYEHDCPSSNNLRVTLASSAIAYRLQWADGTSSVIRAYPEFDNERQQLDPTRNNFSIGSVGCEGDSVPFSKVDTLHSFQLFALFADGTEQPFFASSSAFVRGHESRFPIELQNTCSLGGGLPSLASLPAAPADHSHLQSLWPSLVSSPFLLALAGLSTLVLAGLGAFLLRRRADRTVTLR